MTTPYQDFPPALMLLSPRVTKAGDPGSSIVGINTTPLADGATCYCLENKLDYRLDKTSVAAPDGNLILAPLAGPGRWIADTGGGAESCMVQSGYDQPPSTLLVPQQIAGSAPFPRTDPATTPLAVEFLGVNEVTRGNVVKVAWAATIGNPGGDGNVTERRFTASVAVSFVDSPTFPADYFGVANSQAGTRIPAPVGPNQGDSNFFSMSMLAAFTVPAGVGATVPCTVILIYNSPDGDVIAGGTNLAGFIPGVSVVLEATEYLADCVTQPGPFQLVPFGEG